MRLILNAIVRNEAHVIERALRSVLPFIDGYVILDTGSTDGTQDIVRRTLHGLPGVVYEEPFVNFAATRTRALELAENLFPNDWAITLDADDTYQDPDPNAGNPDRLRAWLSSLPSTIVGAFVQVTHNILRHRRVHIMRLAAKWEYRSVVHEYPHCTTGGMLAEVSPEMLRYFVVGGGNESKSGTAKFLKHAEILEKALADDPDGPEVGRYLYYLGQSYRDAQLYDKAVEVFDRRVRTGGWVEETFYAAFKGAECAALANRPKNEVIHRYQAAWEMRPTRAEPLVELCRYLRRWQAWHLAYVFGRMASEITRPDDVLFVHDDVYQWAAMDEYALACAYTGRRETAHAIWQRLLDEGRVPDAQIARVKANIGYVASVAA